MSQLRGLDAVQGLRPDVEGVLDKLEANVKHRRALQQEEQTKLMGLKTRCGSTPPPSELGLRGTR